MVLSLYSYDPDSGLFRFKSNRGGKIAGDEAGSIRPDGYVSLAVCGRTHLAHRIAWLIANGLLPEEKIDHVNGVRYDNRISNLRAATDAQNRQNQRVARADSLIGLQGVTKTNPNCSRPFIARLKTNGVSKTIGSFETATEAHLAYVEAKRSRHAFCTI